MPPRKSIPRQTRLDVLMEAAYRCGNPRCGHILTLEIHHIVWVRDDGGDDASNLLTLCPNCHSLHTAGHIPAEAIRHWKGMLVALNHAFDRQSMDLLLFLRQEQGPFAVSGDGLLRFAGLIAAGLVSHAMCFRGDPDPDDIEGCEHEVEWSNIFPTSTHRVRLTPRGVGLVDAWIAGDEAAFERLVSSSS